jgi:flagellar biosynthetic protein FliR
MIEVPTNVEALVPLIGAALLAVARPLGLASAAPGWAGAAVGPRMRVLIAAALAGATLPSAPAWASLASAGAGAWTVIWLVELGVGAGLGLTAALVVAGARQAGELVGLQAGLAPASLLDPDGVGGVGADEPLTPLGHLYGLIATAVFLALDGPLRLVDALAASYRAAPPGLGWNGGDAGSRADLLGRLVPELFGRVGSMLGLALQAAAPAGIGTLLAGVALAVLARSAGARPLSGLGWPARAAVGVALTLVMLGVLGTTLAAAWGRWASEFAR